MSRGEHAFDRNDQRLHGLYRDRENGWLFGVCAGIAEHFNVRTALVRLVAFAALLLFFWPAVIVYLAAALLFRAKPLTWSGSCREYEFWRRHGGHDGWRHS
ncbi:MAG TPA: PspC domain-containing protein [Woeseiaceae bacterium]|nr:PspC domain-containing protein [Woeseiaceae bacterium]